MAEHPTPRSPGFRPSHDEAPTVRSFTSDDDDAGARSRDVHRRVVLEAPPAEVWRALTDPTELAEWWGEGSELDATPGGEGRLVEDDEPTRRARVVEVRPERRLVLDLWPEDPESDDPATRVTIELSPCPFGTVLTVFECVLLDLSELPVLAATHPSFIPFPRSARPDGRALARV
jgi:uncharacterized protein YndB with AHSA1/START domain